jgi:hypothetical protein
MTTHVERLRGLVPPAKEAYEEIGAQIEAKMRELTELRAEQTEVRRLIRVFEPEFEKRPYAESSNGKGKRSGASKYSAAKIELVLDWLRSNAETLNQGDGFFASEASAIADCPVNQSGLSAILIALHERGQVRLTKTGVGRGGRKHFKVVV